MIKKHIWLLVTTAILFFSCKDDNNEKQDPPYIHLLATSPYVFSDTVFKAGEDINFHFIVNKGSGNITNFRVELKTDKLETVFDTGVNVSILQFKKTFTKGFAETEEWIFTAMDKNRKERSMRIIVKLDTGAVFEEVRSFDHVILYAQNHLGTPKCFFSLTNDSTYTLEEAFQNQGDMDIVYFYGEDENTIASPGASIESTVFAGYADQYKLDKWTLLNTTRFKPVSLSQQDFESIKTDSSLIALYGAGDGKRKAKNLQAGDAHSFKTESGKTGVFRVNHISGTDQGEVDISIKLQK